MSIIYFAGQDNFGNRGCEALIRSLVKTIRDCDRQAQFIVPSRAAMKDAAQWTGAGREGVQFVEAEPIPGVIRWWSRARRLVKDLDVRPPSYRVSRHTSDSISRSDVLVMTGGDIISLDYGLESLYYWARICEFAMEKGIPTALLGASVGPFSKHPGTERLMQTFLRRFSLITVRETSSLEYLQSLGVEGARLVTDPAFALQREQAPSETLAIFKGTRRVLGFNVSPLIRKFREGNDSKTALDVDVVRFLVGLLQKDPELGVIFVPHVDPLSGETENSDSAYMTRLLHEVRQHGLNDDRVSILPRSLNAAQLKDVIARCTYFIGARTHATIAALSQGVPTISIAYSVKAKGINQDLFGHTRYVLDTPKVNEENLATYFSLLTEEGPAIRSLLDSIMPERKRDAFRSAELLSQLLNGMRKSA